MQRKKNIAEIKVLIAFCFPAIAKCIFLHEITLLYSSKEVSFEKPEKETRLRDKLTKKEISMESYCEQKIEAIRVFFMINV